MNERLMRSNHKESYVCKKIAGMGWGRAFFRYFVLSVGNMCTIDMFVLVLRGAGQTKSNEYSRTSRK